VGEDRLALIVRESGGREVEVHPFGRIVKADHSNSLDGPLGWLGVSTRFADAHRRSCTRPAPALRIAAMKRRTAILALAALPFFAASCMKRETSTTPETKESPAPVEAPADTPPASSKVRFKTNLGEFLVELNPEKAPVTSANFLKYVGEKHYDGTAFHRVIDGFMIQGGGFAMDNGKLVEKATGSGITNESANGLKNDRGTIAMARTADPNSATAQFFINVNNNNALNYPSNGGYAVFGKVIEGMDVVDKIKGVATRTSPLAMRHPGTGQVIESPAGDVPVTPVVIESATAE
jgi:peptidyl-prolyl cis-trans isomerase A (cyclophilin A)